jgi:hypothetical protein
MTRKAHARPKSEWVEPTPGSLPKDAWSTLLHILGRTDGDPEAKTIKKELEAVITNLSVVVALRRVTLGQAKAEMRQVVTAAQALDDGLKAPSMATMFPDTEFFRIELGEFVAACEKELRSLPTKTRRRPHRYDLRSAVQRLNNVFVRYYLHRPGRRRAQDWDRFMREALASAGVSGIPKSGRQLRRYLKSDV